MVLPAASFHDVDNLLSRYRSGRAQQALFDVRGGTVSGYDEFVDPAGNIRPAWQELAECVGERGRGGLNQLRSTVRSLVDNDAAGLRQLVAALGAGGPRTVRFAKVHPSEFSLETMGALGFRPAGTHLLYAATPRSE